MSPQDIWRTVSPDQLPFQNVSLPVNKVERMTVYHCFMELSNHLIREHECSALCKEDLQRLSEPVIYSVPERVRWIRR